MRTSLKFKENILSTEDKKYIQSLSKNLPGHLQIKHVNAYVEAFGIEELMRFKFLSRFVDVYKNKIDFAKEHYSLLFSMGKDLPVVKDQTDWLNYARELFTSDYIFKKNCVFTKVAYLNPR